MDREGRLDIKSLMKEARPMKVHVVAWTSQKYDIIFGCDAIAKLGIKLAWFNGNWRVKIGNQDMTLKAEKKKRSNRISVLSSNTSSSWEEWRQRSWKQAERVFHCEGQPLTATGHTEHAIRLTKDVVVSERQRRYPHKLIPAIQDEINKLLREGVLRKSLSPFCSPIWMVPKKVPQGQPPKYRLVVDFRKLNAVTETESHPMPRLEDVLDRAAGSKVFSTIDLRAGYHQIKMRPQDTAKTAFKFGRCNYEYTRMPFGLKNGPATFQKLMDEVFEELGTEFTQTFMDDIIVYSRSLEEHYGHLEKVFGCLRSYGLKASREKTNLYQEQVKFLGHILDGQGIRADPAKVAAIGLISYPNTARQVRQLLGAVGFYRKFIPGLAARTVALTTSLKKGKKFICTPEMRQEVDDCKRMLESGIVLQYPDLSKPFSVTTDASETALGAVLAQDQGTGEKPVAYASRKLTGPESRYSATDREFLAIVWGVEQFRPYLFGTKFIVRTDHKPLIWEAGLKETSARVTRWKAKLSQYNYTLQHIRGKDNCIADLLSREVLANEVDVDPASAVDRGGGNGNTAEEEEVQSPTLILEWNDCIINAQKNQLIVSNSIEQRLTTKEYRYGRQRIISVKGLSASTVDEFRRLLSQVTLPDELWHVYAKTEDLRNQITIAVADNWANSRPPRLVGCLKRVETVENLVAQNNIIWRYHLGPTNHRGVRETVAKLSRQYFWHNMRDSVAGQLKMCSACKRNKNDRKKIHPKQQVTVTPERPSDIMEADLFTFDGIKYLTVIDRLTKEVWAWPVQNKSAIEIEQALFQCFARVEPPRLLILDQGREFYNARVRDRLAEWNITPHWTTVGHPPSHGAIERAHATLTEHLLILKNERHITGVDAMNRATYAYNNSIHTSHGHTPWEARRVDPTEVKRHIEAEKLRRTTFNNRSAQHEPLHEKDVFRRFYTRRLKTDQRFVDPYEVKAVLPQGRAQLWRIGKSPSRYEIDHTKELRSL